MLVVPRKPLEFHVLDFTEATSVRLSISANTQSPITHIALLSCVWEQASVSSAFLNWIHSVHPPQGRLCTVIQVGHGFRKTVGSEGSAFHLSGTWGLFGIWSIISGDETSFSKRCLVWFSFWYQELNFRPLWILLNLWWRG